MAVDDAMRSVAAAAAGEMFVTRPLKVHALSFQCSPAIHVPDLPHAHATASDDDLQDGGDMELAVDAMRLLLLPNGAVPKDAADIIDLLGKSGALAMMKRGDALVAAWLSGKAAWFRQRLLDELPAGTDCVSARDLKDAIKVAHGAWKQKVTAGDLPPLIQSARVQHSQGPGSVLRWSGPDLEALNKSKWTAPLVQLIELGSCTPMVCEAAVADSGKHPAPPPPPRPCAHAPFGLVCSCHPTTCLWGLLS